MRSFFVVPLSFFFVFCSFLPIPWGDGPVALGVLLLQALAPLAMGSKAIVPSAPEPTSYKGGDWWSGASGGSGGDGGAKAAGAAFGLGAFLSSPYGKAVLVVGGVGCIAVGGCLLVQYGYLHLPSSWPSWLFGKAVKAPPAPEVVISLERMVEEKTAGLVVDITNAGLGVDLNLERMVQDKTAGVKIILPSAVEDQSFLVELDSSLGTPAVEPIDHPVLGPWADGASTLEEAAGLCGFEEGVYDQGLAVYGVSRSWRPLFARWLFYRCLCEQALERARQERARRAQAGEEPGPAYSPPRATTTTFVSSLFYFVANPLAFFESMIMVNPALLCKFLEFLQYYDPTFFCELLKILTQRASGDLVACVKILDFLEQLQRFLAEGSRVDAELSATLAILQDFLDKGLAKRPKRRGSKGKGAMGAADDI